MYYNNIVFVNCVLRTFVSKCSELKSLHSTHIIISLYHETKDYDISYKTRSLIIINPSIIIRAFYIKQKLKLQSTICYSKDKTVLLSEGLVKIKHSGLLNSIYKFLREFTWFSIIVIL